MFLMFKMLDKDLYAQEGGMNWALKPFRKLFTNYSKAWMDCILVKIWDWLRMSMNAKTLCNAQNKSKGLERMTLRFILVQPQNLLVANVQSSNQHRAKTLVLTSTSYKLGQPFSIGYPTNFKGLNLRIPHPKNTLKDTPPSNNLEGYHTFTQN